MNPATPHESAFSFHPLPKSENENRQQSNNGFMSCFKRDTPLAAASHRSFFSRGRLLDFFPFIIYHRIIITNSKKKYACIESNFLNKESKCKFLYRIYTKEFLIDHS